MIARVAIIFAIGFILVVDQVTNADDPLTTPNDNNQPATTTPSPIEILKLQKDLFNAASEGNISRVEDLLALGYLDANWRDGQAHYNCYQTVLNATALIEASNCNQSLEVTTLLVNAGADTNAKEDKYGLFPLLLAALNDAINVVNFLISKGANTSQTTFDNTNLMHFAAWNRNGDAAIVQLMLDNGFNVNSANKNGWTPLLYAASSGHADVASLLLNHGADVKAKLGTSFTVSYRAYNSLRLASYFKYLDVVKLLVDHGADVSEANMLDGSTPLIYVAWGSEFPATIPGRSAIAQYLLDNGANVNAKTNNNARYKGYTALMFAAHYKNQDLVQLLASRGASRAGCDNSKSTFNNLCPV